MLKRWLDNGLRVTSAFGVLLLVGASAGLFPWLATPPKAAPANDEPQPVENSDDPVESPGDSQPRVGVNWSADVATPRRVATADERPRVQTLGRRDVGGVDPNAQPGAFVWTTATLTPAWDRWVVQPAPTGDSLVAPRHPALGRSLCAHAPPSA
jgi:hypothetical protein